MLRRFEAASHTVDSICKLQVPATVSWIRSFLGLPNVSRRFVPSVAVIVSQPSKWPRQSRLKEPRLYTEEDLSALETVQKKLTSPPVLSLQKSYTQYRSDTDNFDRPICYVLGKTQDKATTKSVRCWSRTLRDEKKSLDETHRECLVVVRVVLLLGPYLEGCWFIVRPNLHALRWMLKLSDAVGKLARWLLWLMQYDFEIVHRADVKRQAADALSRLPSAG